MDRFGDISDRKGKRVYSVKEIYINTIYIYCKRIIIIFYEILIKCISLYYSIIFKFEIIKKINGMLSK